MGVYITQGDDGETKFVLNADAKHGEVNDTASELESTVVDDSISSSVRSTTYIFRVLTVTFRIPSMTRPLRPHLSKLRT